MLCISLFCYDRQEGYVILSVGLYVYFSRIMQKSGLDF